MLVVESVRDRNEFFIPAIVARLVTTNQQDGASARIERKEHAIVPAGMLNSKFLHVRVPRRMNQISVWPRKAWSEFLQQDHFRVHIDLFALREAAPPVFKLAGEFDLPFHIRNIAHRLWQVKSALSNKETVIVDMMFCMAYINWPESAMSFLDSNRPPNRSVLWLFYSSAFLSAIMFSAASYAEVSYQRPLLVLALAIALAAAFFLVIFLRSRDERERQINYQALTFAFVGTLVFSFVVGLAQRLGFHSLSWLGIPALMIILWSVGLILNSWRDQ